MASLTERGQEKLKTVLLWIGLLAPVAVELSGFRSAHILSQPVWTSTGLARFASYGIALITAGAGFMFLARRHFLPFVFGTGVLCTIFAVGLAPLGSMALFIFSATVLGSLIFGRKLELPLAFFGGSAVWVLIMTCSARLPVHYEAAYLAALALPLALDVRFSRELASRWLHLLRPAYTPSYSEFISMFFIIFLIGAHWVLVLKPEVSTDGLAMHLAIASNIALHHSFTIDFRQFVWALMPMGADWCYAVVYVLGGEYAARLLNFAFLVVIAASVFSFARRFVSRAAALLVVALFLSTPMVQLVTTSLFVENVVAAMSFGAAIALWKFYDDGTYRSLTLTVVLLGTSIALKLAAVPIALFVLPFLAGAIWRWRQRFDAAALIGSGAILITIAAIPYIYAYWRSGNPVFPFSNSVFHSPYFGNENLADKRYQQPLSWLTPVMLTFRTSRYFEGQNGSFGLQYFLFLPLTLAGLVWMRSFAARSAAVAGLGSALVFAAAIPNARYFYPALPFLTAGAVAALALLQNRHKRIFQAFLCAAVLAALLNTYLLPASGWLHKDFFSAPLFSEAGRRSYMREWAPVRELVAYVNRVDRISPVVFTDSSAIAGLIPPAYSFTWHDYRFQQEVETRLDPEDLYRFFKQLGVRHLLVEPNDTRQLTIKVFLENCVQPEYSVSNYSVARMKSSCHGRLPDLMPLTAGVYDETDRRMIFLGNWTQMAELPSAYRKTVTYSDHAGSELRFRFIGRGFRYSYTGAINRGIAEVVVDGIQRRVVDLYSFNNAWQTSLLVADLSPGVHDAVIRATGRQASGATGHVIDVDSIEILADTKRIKAATQGD